MKRLLLVTLLSSMLLMSGCGNLEMVSTPVDSNEVAIEIQQSDYIVSDLEEDTFDFMGVEFENILPTVTEKYSVEVYIADYSASMYRTQNGFNRYIYTVTLKDIDGNIGFVVTSSDLYWKYLGQVDIDIVTVDLYTSSDGAEFIVVDGKYLFESCFDMYLY